MEIGNWIWGFIVAMGIPSAITGLLVWKFKKDIDERDKAKEKRDDDRHKLMLMMMKTGHANYVLSSAIAMAIQRIPDAHCNGDMKAALAEATKLQQEEQDFLVDKGTEHIFGD